MKEHAFDLGEGKTLGLTCSISFASYPFILRLPGAIAWEASIRTSRAPLVFYTGETFEASSLEASPGASLRSAPSFMKETLAFKLPEVAMMEPGMKKNAPKTKFILSCIQNATYNPIEP